LIDSYQDIQQGWLEGVNAIGIAAGASAPEVLVSQVIKFLKEQGAEDKVEELTVVEENVEFLLPKELLLANKLK
jgi:4-hydroxy-3-methylbut-2-enyl diphosphate reductase